jgi:hypothetical protein
VLPLTPVSRAGAPAQAAPPRTAPPAAREKTYYYTGTAAPSLPAPASGVRGSAQAASPQLALPAYRAAPQGKPGDKPGKPPPGDFKAPDDLSAYNIQLDVPGKLKLFRLETEASLRERMRQEARKGGERLVFPDEPVLSKEPYVARAWAPLTRLVEPYYLIHGRLLFEQKNFDRYGWDLGPVTPLVCAGKFFWDVAWLPYHAATRPCQQYETSAGYCLPGDPVPLLLYPPELSATGLMAQASTVVGAFFVFP